MPIKIYLFIKTKQIDQLKINYHGVEPQQKMCYGFVNCKYAQTILSSNYHYICGWRFLIKIRKIIFFEEKQSNAVGSAIKHYQLIRLVLFTVYMTHTHILVKYLIDTREYTQMAV